MGLLCAGTICITAGLLRAGTIGITAGSLRAGTISITVPSFCPGIIASIGGLLCDRLNSFGEESLRDFIISRATVAAIASPRN